MTSTLCEEDFMVAIKNDEIDNFLNLAEKHPSWTNYYLKEEDLYFPQYAASKRIFTKHLELGVF